MTQKDLIVCFIGGSGGHFIASLCQFLLYGIKNSPGNDGSLHHIRKTFVFHHGILPRDNTIDSWIKEHDMITKLSKSPLAIGHFRNLSLLQELGWHVIYITFDDDDCEEINNRVMKKVNLPPIETITQEQYNMLKGGGWPTWIEYKKGAIAEELDDKYVRLKNHDECLQWSYIVPTVSKQLCNITFKNILQGSHLIDKLCSFLNIENFDRDYLESYIDQYRQSQR